MPIIRDYCAADLGALTELMADLGYPTTEAAMARRMDKIQGNPLYRTFVAEVDGIVAGMIGLRQLPGYENDRDPIQICALVTKAEYRGLGIGTSLIAHAETWAAALGAGALFLTSGNRPERAGAHDFYKRLGFEETGYRFSKKMIEPTPET